MSFIIQTVDGEGRVAWIKPDNNRGFRTIGERGEAARFADREAAEAVIYRMPSIFAEMGLEYSIEPADESERKDAPRG